VAPNLVGEWDHSKAGLGHPARCQQSGWGATRALVHPMASPILLRRHGERGPTVVVLHGGPGAQGSAWGLARGLADDFTVLEPMQRRADGLPLTVARHVEDLLALLDDACPDEPPSIVGHSWGAMLALAFAAAHPQRAAAIGLVGCGTFDPVARAALLHTIDRRMGVATRLGLAALQLREDRDGALADSGSLIEPLHTWDGLARDPCEPAIICDAQGHQESWEDMIHQQEGGVYPAAFSAIRCPVLMIHGRYDPHPGPMIRETLERHLPQLAYRELGGCGHYPWRERRARSAFFSSLISWLHRKGRML
jgi:pimeloyl-ACP methyl ester carboxylesterase